MSALAQQYESQEKPQYQAPAGSRPPVRGRLATRPGSTRARRALPAFPNETLYFEPKAINNNAVVRADHPAQTESCWRTLGAIFGVAMLFTALLLPGAYKSMAGRENQRLDDEQRQLLKEIDEYRAQETAYTTQERLEKVAKSQDLVDPPASQVVHLTPSKGAYAMNGLPSGK